MRNFKHEYVGSCVMDDDEKSITIIDPSLMILIQPRDVNKANWVDEVVNYDAMFAQSDALRHKRIPVRLGPLSQSVRDSRSCTIHITLFVTHRVWKIE